MDEQTKCADCWRWKRRHHGGAPEEVGWCPLHGKATHQHEYCPDGAREPPQPAPLHRAPA